MNSIAPVHRFRDAPRVTAVGRLALILVLAMAAVLGDARAGRADGPLTLRASVPLGYRAHDIIIEGDVAYIATEKGLTILDISDRVHPVVRSSEPSTKGNRSQGLAKKGSHLYLAAGKAGMQVIDVSNLDDPRTIANAWKGGTIYDVAVHPTGQAAYAISYGGELYVWDIADPAKPVLTQQLGVLHWRRVCPTCVGKMLNLTPSGGAQATGVSTAGNVVSSVDWNYGGYYAWDSTDPLHLTFIGTHRAPVSFRAEVDLARDVVYVLGTYSKGSGVHTMKLSELRQDPDHVTYPLYLQPAGTEACTVCDFEPSAVPMDGGGIGFSGKYVFYAGGRGKGELAIIDATDPAHMVKVASVPLGPTYIKTAQGMGVAAKGNFLYVAAGMLGVLVYEFPGLSNP